MKGRKKIFKKDIIFQDKLKNFNYSNFEPIFLLELKNEAFGRAEFWKEEILDTFSSARFSLLMAHTNKHSNVHKKISRQWIKSYYCKNSIIFYNACIDKLAQFLCEIFNLYQYNPFDENSVKKREKKVGWEFVLKKLKGSSNNTEKRIYKIFNKLRSNTELTKNINEGANSLKHRWTMHFEGTGLKDKITREENIDKNGRKQKIVYFGYKKGLGVDETIKILLKFNNFFVKSTEEIIKELNYEMFYIRNKSGEKIIYLGKGMEDGKK